MLASLPLNEKNIVLSETPPFTSIGQIIMCASLTISNPQSSRTSWIVFRKVHDRSHFQPQMSWLPCRRIGYPKRWTRSHQSWMLVLGWVKLFYRVVVEEWNWGSIQVDRGLWRWRRLRGQSGKCDGRRDVSWERSGRYGRSDICSTDSGHGGSEVHIEGPRPLLTRQRTRWEKTLERTDMSSPPRRI
jgi:hypothetical protein